MNTLYRLSTFTRSNAFRLIVLVAAVALFVLAAGAPNATIGIGK
jgi:hypothetical protein